MTGRFLIALVILFGWTLPAAAQLTNPSAISFSHTDFSITDYYRIGYFTSSGATTPTQTGILSKPQTCSPCTGPLPNPPTADGTWYVAVQATNSIGSSDWSTKASFIVSSPAPLPSNIIPIFPPNGATGVTTTLLQWDATNATSYNVGIGTSSPPPTVAVGVTVKSYTPNPFSAGIQYFWQITAINATGSTLGPVWTFTAAQPQPTWAAPYTISVSPTTAPTTISFYHDAFSLASSYTIGYFKTATANKASKTSTLTKPASCNPCMLTFVSRPRGTWYLAVRANSTTQPSTAYSSPRVRVVWP